MRLRNDTVFARFGVTVEIYENVREEEKKSTGKVFVALRHLAHLGDVPFFFFLHLSPRSSFPLAHAHMERIYTHHTDVLQAIPVHGGLRARAHSLMYHL